MKLEFDYKEYFKDQLKSMQKQEKELEDKLSKSKKNMDQSLKNQIEKLKKKREEYEQQIILAQMKDSDALDDTKSTLDKIWNDIKEGYEKIKEDVN